MRPPNGVAREGATKRRPEVEAVSRKTVWKNNGIRKSICDPNTSQHELKASVENGVTHAISRDADSDVSQKDSRFGLPD